MMRPALILGLGGLLAAGSAALELFVNGDFETALAPPWLSDTGGPGTFIVRATTFDPDPDYEVLVQKGSGNGHAKLWQTIAVPSPEVVFSITAKLQASATWGATRPWAVAAILLYYEDQLGRLYGTTCIARPSTHCPWTSSDSFRLITVADEEWRTHTIDVAQELQYFAGVDPQAVSRIRVGLAAVVGADC
ncbi:MAG: hypothetical protein FJY75_06385 [Candidatus Eisenbacteria bacterium]|uniref:DUF3047 domain-containing protein n=1 Tax=Eiseniibacteriota bacterium TaxID=2212470 RepID=A0A937XAI4_UNCEI|nr:hypothetical protein [Candidatus Eisenbacteria bacterium]